MKEWKWKYYSFKKLVSGYKKGIMFPMFCIRHITLYDWEKQLHEEHFESYLHCDLFLVSQHPALFCE